MDASRAPEPDAADDTTNRPDAHTITPPAADCPPEEPTLFGDLWIWHRADCGVERDAEQIRLMRSLAAPRDEPFDALQDDDESKPAWREGTDAFRHPYVEFDGIDDRLVYSGPLYADSVGVTMTFVVRALQKRDGDNSNLLNMGRPQERDLAVVFDPTRLVFRVAAHTARATTTNGFSWVIASVGATFGSTARGVFVRINGRQEDVSHTGDLFQAGSAELDYSATRGVESGPLTLGGPATLMNEELRHFRGDLAEMRVYGRYLNPDELNDVECELSNRYGIALDVSCP
jgi:hypothetical protein